MTNKFRKITPNGEVVLTYLNPLQIIFHLFQYRALIQQFTKREIISRYKGSFIGIGWSFIYPLLMLGIYTFVFSIIFNAKWPINTDESTSTFSLTLFMGLITFDIFSEVINKATLLIHHHTNYVKKVIFPLEILPVISLLSALVHSFFSLGVLFIGKLIIAQKLSWMVLLLPLMWLPMLIFTLGCGYIIATIGVYIRDIKGTVEVLTNMLFFLTPIFYSHHVVPEKFRFFCTINPLAVFVENSRRVFLWSIWPDWSFYIVNFGLSIIVCIAGFMLFMKNMKNFADVL